MRSYIPVALLLPVLIATGAEGGTLPASRAADKDPPTIVLLAPDVALTLLDVQVLAEDTSGIAKVFVSVNGRIVEGRISPPFNFRIAVDQVFPIELCATADDTRGNSAIDCKTIEAARECTDNADCEAGEFCLKAAGQCLSRGGCAPLPQECPTIVDPVCGCDRRTYDNSCMAHRAGVSVAGMGKCDDVPAVLLLEVLPQALLSCTDVLSLTATVFTDAGIPVPNVVVVFAEVPPSTISGSFAPAATLVTDAAGQAVVVWQPSIVQCTTECSLIGGGDGLCLLSFQASDISGSIRSSIVDVVDHIP